MRDSKCNKKDQNQHFTNMLPTFSKFSNLFSKLSKLESILETSLVNLETSLENLEIILENLEETTGIWDLWAIIRAESLQKVAHQ